MVYSCCVCAGDCDCRGSHSYCARHECLRSPFAFPHPRRYSAEDWLLIALIVGCFVAAALMLPGCAARAPAPVVAEQPASAPAPSPASQPACVKRELFDKLAQGYISLWRQKGEDLADCNEALTMKAADYDAAVARVRELELQVKLTAILGTTGAALVTAAVSALVAHFAHPAAAH